jgi:hypothetical protein
MDPVTAALQVVNSVINVWKIKKQTDLMKETGETVIAMFKEGSGSINDLTKVTLFLMSAVILSFFGIIIVYLGSSESEMWLKSLIILIGSIIILFSLLLFWKWFLVTFEMERQTLREVLGKSLSIIMQNEKNRTLLETTIIIQNLIYKKICGITSPVLTSRDMNHNSGYDSDIKSSLIDDMSNYQIEQEKAQLRLNIAKENSHKFQLNKLLYSDSILLACEHIINYYDNKLHFFKKNDKFKLVNSLKELKNKIIISKQEIDIDSSFINEFNEIMSKYDKSCAVIY